MPPVLKALSGLAAVLAASFVWHGPMGHGEAYVAGLERRARAVIAEGGMTGVEVKLDRAPIARNATFSGVANDFQRRGMLDEPGLIGRVALIPGVARVRWDDEPVRERAAMPLLAETAILAALAYLIGLALGWLLWGRPRRTGFA
jgi:hypothetical protein